MRFRAGKNAGSGCVPGAYSERTAPPASMICAINRRFSGGYAISTPQPSPARTQRPAVRTTVDPACGAADYRHPRRSELISKLHCGGFSIRRKLPCADDADASRIGKQHTAIIQHNRRIEDFLEDDRIKFLIYRHQPNAALFALLLELLRKIGVLVCVMRKFFS